MARRVFIDANQLITFGHGLKGAEAKTLRELIHVGAVRLVLTDLTISEVAKKFAKNDTERLLELTRSDLRTKAKRHLNIDLPEIDSNELWKKVFDVHFKTVKEFARECGAEILKIEDVSPTVVLDDYTHSRGMFSESSKKDQFPDAFIFEALKKSASAETSLLLLSRDDDFTQACNGEEHIKKIATFQALLDELGVASADPADYRLIERFEDEFNDPVEEALQEFTIHADDVEDGEMEVLGVSNTTIDSLTVYKSKEDENTYLVYARVSPTVEVSFSHPDWDSAMWDSEDKVLIPFENIGGTKEVEMHEVAMTFTFIYDPEDDTATVEDASVRGSGFLTATLYPYDHYK